MGLLRRAEESFYGARKPLFPLGFSSLLGHNSPYTLPCGAGTTTDGGQLAKLLQVRHLSAGLKADLTIGGLRHREEKIWRGGREVLKVPEDASL